MRTPCALVALLLVAGCSQPPEVSIPENREDLPPASHMESTLRAEEDANKQIALITVQEAVHGFRLLDGEKRYPASLHELVKKGMMESLPELPPGYRFNYDPAAGKVGIEEGEPEPEPEPEEVDVPGEEAEEASGEDVSL